MIIVIKIMDITVEWVIVFPATGNNNKRRIGTYRQRDMFTIVWHETEAYIWRKNVAIYNTNVTVGYLDE